jgi:hypothetical protein
MTTQKNAKEAEQWRFTVLRKLEDVGQPMNMLEIGFTATPQFIRNMAARGLVRVTVTITERGRDALAAAKIVRAKQKVKAEKLKRGVA